MANREVPGKDQFKKHIARIVKSYKKKKGLSYRKLAEESEYSKTFLHQVADAKTIPNAFSLYKIAVDLDIPFHLFFKQDLVEEEIVDPAKYAEENENYSQYKIKEMIEEAYHTGVSIEKLQQAIDLVKD